MLRAMGDTLFLYRMAPGNFINDVHVNTPDTLG